MLEIQVIKVYLHLFYHLLGLLCGAGGMTAIYLYKSAITTDPISGAATLVPSSAHSWLGLGFFGSWMMQCISKLCLRDTKRLHQFLGYVTYTTGLAACALGLQSLQSRDLLLANVSANNGTIILVNRTAAAITPSWVSNQTSISVVLLAVSGIATLAPFKKVRAPNIKRK